MGRKKKVEEPYILVEDIFGGNNCEEMNKVMKNRGSSSINIKFAGVMYEYDGKEVILKDTRKKSKSYKQDMAVISWIIDSYENAAEGV